MSDRAAAADEVRGADLEDARLSHRFVQLVEMLEQHPDASFPDACGSDRNALEATYRFLRNRKVTYERLMDPHIRASVDRMVDRKVALVVHDTTEFVFKGDREGLGRVQSKLQGFMGHFALAVSADGMREALGVVGMRPIFRPQTKVTAHWRARYFDPSKESRRWGELVDDVATRVAGRVEIIHVMDREADSYELLSKLCLAGHRFVIRTRFASRRTSEGHLEDSLVGLETMTTREVSLSFRRERHMTGTGKSAPRPARHARVASLHVRARSVTLRRPARTPLPEELRVNVVHVTEPAPPPGQEPVDWKLYTTEPIDSVEAVLKIVDHYRSRWVIEEYFKALKTGCSYEKRQLGNRHTLLNALAVLTPIAWTLLALRQQCRSPQPSALSALTAQQLHVLRKFSRPPLPETPSAREVLLAVAALGGHIKNNGEPGWMVLGRGLERLLAYEVGWSAAIRDQS